MTRHLNIKAFLYIVVPLSILLWVLCVFLTELGPDPIWSAIKKIPTVIMIDFGFWLLFCKMGLEMEDFSRLVSTFPSFRRNMDGGDEIYLD